MLSTALLHEVWDAMSLTWWLSPSRTLPVGATADPHEVTAWSSISSIVLSHPLLSISYTFAVFFVGRQINKKGALKQRAILAAMAQSYIILLLLAAASTLGQGTSTGSSERAEFTVPASADEGKNLIPWIKDPEAVDPQTKCPGYTASNVQTTDTGVTASLSLAGDACNLYGTDVDFLTLTVETQGTDRFHVEIQPQYVGAENETWFILPEALIPKPTSGESTALGDSDFDFEWSNEPTFAFTVKRKETGDVLFTTNGTKLIYEDQFIEFASPLPENYNLYGLGEVIHGFRLGNNLTSK